MGRPPKPPEEHQIKRWFYTTGKQNEVIKKSAAKLGISESAFIKGIIDESIRDNTLYKDIRVRVIINFFRDRYAELFTRPYPVKWAKDGSSVKRVLQLWDETEIKADMCSFLEGEEPIPGAGYSIGIWESTLHRRSRKKNEPPPPPLEGKRVINPEWIKQAEQMGVKIEE